MKRIKIVGLCLTAVFAMTAVAAASASAAGPEYFTCAKVKGGKFEKGCGKEGGKGGYSREAVTKLPSKFTDKNGVSVLTVFVPGIGIVGDTKCEKAKSKGAILSSTTAEDTVVFEKCESSGKTCTSDQAKEKKGDITTNPLLTTLVATSEAASGVGVQVEAKGGGNSAEFDCEGLLIKTTGAVTGEDKGNVEKASKTAENVFAVNEGGEPTIKTGGSEDTLLTTITKGEETNTVPSGESTTAVIKGAEIGVSL
jgi:hypothetical protein